MTGTNVTEGYIIDPTWGRERERLALLAELADPDTHQRLERLGVAAGWHCLDVGAGSGSVATWLADRVGRAGRVVATDLDTRFLDGAPGRGVEVLRHDVLADDFPERSFDLIHTRAVLMHLAEPERAIARMASWLRPDGVLLLEEFDGMFAPCISDPRLEQISEALRGSPAMDIHCGRTLPARMVAAGLADVAAQSRTSMVRGGSRSARFYELSVEAVATPLEAAGVWSRDDIDTMLAYMADPTWFDFGLVITGCWGRRPG